MYSTLISICILLCSLSVILYFFHTEANPIAGAPVEDPIPDSLPQEAHFTPTTPREGGQSLDLGLLPGKGCQ